MKTARMPVPNSAVAVRIDFSEHMMNVYLHDGRTVSVPLAWSQRLVNASPEQRANYEIGASGRGLHWPDLDEDIAVAGLMAGADWQGT